MEKAVPIRFLMTILTQIKCMVIATFTHLGLFKSPGGESSATNAAADESNNYVLMSDGSSPSLVPVPVTMVTASIKKMLPVVEYSDFVERKGEVGMEGRDCGVVDEEGRLSCAVCWDGIEGTHQIRELSNCCHVFHRECLDRWVDEGKVTCPLCRSMLLPARTNPWMVLRNACPPSASENEREGAEGGCQIQTAGST